MLEIEKVIIIITIELKSILGYLKYPLACFTALNSFDLYYCSFSWCVCENDFGLNLTRVQIVISW